MGRTVRLFEGRFGRLMLTDLAANDPIQAQADPAIVLEQGAEEILLLNPGELYVPLSITRALEFHAAGDWLRASFPAAFEEEDQRPFPQLRELVTPRIRQLADTLAVEVLNDRFLSNERLEFMLQELLLSIVETYLAKRRSSSPLWKGSRFSDLFQVCTGFSPRADLDMLCVETAISRLASGRGKIAEVAAELGFSAQSNFTRFFLNQVGVPPSEYRRATQNEEPAAAPPKQQP